MRWWPVIMLVLGFSLTSQAASVDKNIWHACQADTDCIVVAGTCTPTAVNAMYKKEAAQHYAERRTNTKCPQQFWAPKTKVARCHLNACETVVN
jgi:hypothetical protein